MSKIKAAIIFFYLFTPISHAQDRCLVDKYIFDIGSGGVKNTGYLVDTCNKVIIKTIASYYDSNLRLQECISASPDGKTISPTCVNSGSKTIALIKKKLGIDCKRQICKAIATAWGRTSKNPEDLISEIRMQGVDISILNQHEEGKLAFLSLATDQIPSENTLIFDLGGGSFQLSGKNTDGTIYVYNGPYGMFNFKHAVLAEFGDGKTDVLPYLSLDKIKDFALKEVGYGIRHDQYIQSKTSQSKMKVTAIGVFMNRGVKHQLNLGEQASLEDIEKAISNLVGKTASEIQKIYPNLPTEHAINTQFSLLIIYAVMKEAKIAKFNIASNNKIYEYLAIHDNI